MKTAPKQADHRQPDQKIVNKVRRGNNQITPFEMMPGEADQEFMPQPMQRPQPTSRPPAGPWPERGE